MTKIISIAVLLFLMYRLISNGGRFLGSNNDVQNSQPKEGEYVDYEEVESKTKK